MRLVHSGGLLAFLTMCTILFLANRVHGLLGYTPPARLLAIGDLHGDIVNAKEILKFAQIIDCEGKWIAGRDTVIQVGDVIDRGPHGHEIIEYFAELRTQAAHSGGEFIQLLGNHELMNMQGDMKFVNPKTVTAFGSLDRLKLAFDPVLGPYGSHLARTCDAAVIRNRTVFVHAGILPIYARLGIPAMNRMVREAILAKNFSDPILMNDGPLWTREVIYPALKGNCSNVEASLAALSHIEMRHGRSPIDHMVVGHTIMQDGSIHELCGGKLFAIDIAISQYMVGGGKMGILEMRYDFAHGTDKVHPYIQYPSQPFRQHALPPVMYPLRIPLPLVDAKEKSGVQGAALTIRTNEDALTQSELVLLCIAFVIVAAIVASQQLRRHNETGSWAQWLGLNRKKSEHNA